MQAIAAFLFFSASLHLALGILSLFRRQAFFIYALGLLIGVAVFQFGYGMELLSTHIEDMIFWKKVEFLAVPFLPFFLTAFALFLVRQHVPGLRYTRFIHLAWLVPLSLTLLRWTNEYHGLYTYGLHVVPWRDGFLFRYSIGPVHHVQDAITCMALIFSTLIMMRFLFKSGRGKACAYLCLLTINLLPFVAVLFLVLFAPPLDPTPFALSIAGPLFTLGLYKLHLFVLSPVARESVFDALENAVVVLDRRYRIMDANTAACMLFSPADGDILGKEVTRVIPAISLEELPPLGSLASLQQEIALSTAYALRYYAVTLRSLPKSRGWTLVFYETTERKELESRLRKLSFHDSLTGLYNRTYYEEELQRMRTGRESPLGIIVIDLNGLKAANDTHGHQVGDEMIRLAGSAIGRSVRKDEVAARTGGDEFMVLLRRCDPQHLDLAMSRLRTQFATCRLENGLPLYAAMGGSIAMTPDQIERAQHDADEAMYADKRRSKAAALLEILEEP